MCPEFSSFLSAEAALVSEPKQLRNCVYLLAAKLFRSDSSVLTATRTSGAAIVFEGQPILNDYPTEMVETQNRLRNDFYQASFSEHHRLRFYWIR